MLRSTPAIWSALPGHSFAHSPQPSHRARSKITASPSRVTARCGQISAQWPQEKHLSAWYSSSGLCSCVVGLEHQRQRRGAAFQENHGADARAVVDAVVLDVFENSLHGGPSRALQGVDRAAEDVVPAPRG